MGDISRQVYGIQTGSYDAKDRMAAREKTEVFQDED